MFEYFVKKLSKDNRGFTLIELVVVIAILGILSAIAVPKFSKSRLNAAVSAHNANVRTIESAANMYLADNPDGKIETAVENPHVLQLYIQEWPKVPKELQGKTFTAANGTATVTIAGDATYTITIDTNGGIIVAPGKITNEEVTTTTP